MSVQKETLPATLGGEPVRPKGPPGWPPDDPEILDALKCAHQDGSWGKYHGSNCGRLREVIAEYQGQRFVELCCSGTAAVELALRGIKAGEGDEVILAAYDFKGNFMDVVCVGATPVLVDINPANGNLDPAHLSEAITPKTKGIIISHLHGGVVPMERVLEVAEKHQVSVVEDAAQLPGAVICERKAGTWGHTAIFSFGGSKVLSAGRGGVVMTDDDAIAQRIRLHCNRGNHAYPLSELHATVLLPQFKRLDERNIVRAENAFWLCDQLKDFDGLYPFDNGEQKCEPGFYKLGFWYEPAAFSGLSRESFTKAMRAEGIAMDPGFRSLHIIHSSSRYRGLGDLPNSTAADERVVKLHHPVLLGTRSDMEDIMQALNKVKAHSAPIREKLDAVS